MPFGMDYGGTCRPRPHCVRWEPSSGPKGHNSPLNFGRCLLWPNGWMDQNATWYGGRPQRRRHCFRWRHVPIGKRFEPSTVLWAFHTIQPSSLYLTSVPLRYVNLFYRNSANEEIRRSFASRSSYGTSLVLSTFHVEFCSHTSFVEDKQILNYTVYSSLLFPLFTFGSTTWR